MEGKDSFILYTKYISIFKALTIEQRGILITHIFEYVNDEIPEEEEDNLNDLTIKIAWLAIKNDLKEDLVKWKDTCKKRSDAGKLGGAPKGNTNATKQAKQANGCFDKNENKQKQAKHAKQADSDYDCEYDCEYECVNESSKEDKSNICTELSELALELPAIKCPKGLNSYPIFKNQIKEWQDVYIGVDVLFQLKQMKLWLDANPKSRKTYSGLPRFINSWLSREQDKASRYNVNRKATPKQDDNGGIVEL